MGHLTRISNSIVHNCDKGPNGPQIQHIISGMDLLSSPLIYLYSAFLPTNIQFIVWARDASLMPDTFDVDTETRF